MAKTELLYQAAFLTLLALSIPATAVAVCGDESVDSGEECDDGGTCIRSSNAGAHCTGAAQCPGGTCQSFGGDGCAANCTMEHDVPYYVGGSSQFTAQTPIGAFPFQLSGTLVLTAGKQRNGEIPVVLRSHLNRIAVDGGGIGCTCIRGIALKTCGGTLLEADGTTPSADCTLDAAVCTDGKPCAFVHGAGNAGTGTIGCETLPGVNLTSNLDCRVANAIPSFQSSGSGGPGSAMLLPTFATAVASGFCDRGSAISHGPDRKFCTDDDPIDQIGEPTTAPLVTGQTLGQVQTNFDSIPAVSASGAPFSCAALEANPPSAAGAGLVSSGGACGIPFFGDAAYLFRFQAVTPTLTPTATATGSPTATGQATATPTTTVAIPTATATPVATPTATAIVTSTATAMSMSTATRTATVPAVATGTPTSPASPSPTGTALAGDANCDDRLSAADLPSVISQMAAGSPPQCGADANGDLELEASDVEAIAVAIFAPG